MLHQIVLKYLSVRPSIHCHFNGKIKQQTRKETTAQLHFGFYRLHILHLPQNRNASYITHHLIH